MDTMSSANNCNDPVLLRPTEAQLRWAQFHHKRRSQGVRQKVEAMYQTPANTEDVDGAMPEDGNSTTGLSSSSETRRIRKRRPKVSRGRRALLRVSRRTYQRRKQEIEQHGFRGITKQITESDEDDDEEDALNEIFMMRKHRRRRRRGAKGTTKDESYKRFQAACHAMMMSIAASATPNHSIEVPTKKWTRTADHIAASSLYDEYLDPKWGIRRRPNHADDPSNLQPYNGASLMPIDRAASWMIHLPKVEGGARENPYYNDFSDVPSGSFVNSEAKSETSTSTLAMRAPGQKKFNQLVALVQQRMIQKAEEYRPGPAPKMHLRQLTISEDQHENQHQRKYPIQMPTENLSDDGQSGHYQRQRQKFERERKISYIPRMRLQDFLPEGATVDGNGQGSFDPNSGVSPTTVPRMRLREFEALKKQEPRRLSKAMEIAQLLEAGNQKNESKAKQMAKSLEGDKTPKMRLRQFDLSQDGDSDEKKVSEDLPAPRRKPHPLSDRFLPSDDQCCSRCSRPSPVGSMTQSDFFASVRAMNSTPVNGKTAQSPSSRVSDFFSQVKKMNVDDAANSASRVADFFSKSQSQDYSAPESSERLGRDMAGHARNSDFFAQVRQMNAIDSEGRLLCEYCLEDDVVAEEARKLSGGEFQFGPASGKSAQDDDTKSEASAISELWSRGRSSFNTIASKLNSISEKAPISGVSSTPRTSASTPGGNMAKTAAAMSGRVGGFFQALRPSTDDKPGQDSKSGLSIEQQRQENIGPSREDGKAAAVVGYLEDQKAQNELMSPKEEQEPDNDYTALAGFRKSQQVKRESMPPEDDSSSLSSYRALPDNIRKMVKTKNGSPTNDTPPPAEPLAHEETERSNIGSQFLAKFAVASPDRSTILSRTTIEDMSPEKYKQLHEKVIQGYAEKEKSIIDTDGTESDISGTGMDPQILANLMLSPDLLTKRHHQAICAIESREWDQVCYLINANPWLVEMCELTTNQYLLHKIAFFGAAHPPAPEDLCMQMIEMFPAAMHKFDQDGNVPLHLAAAAGHMKMITSLGDKFSSGASIRNEDGMLPLHFAIASYGAMANKDNSKDTEENPSPIRVIKTVLKLFPQGIAIADNDGNLPLHVAVECLEGGLGVDVIYLLLDEADRQLQDPFGARFRHKAKLEDIVNDDMSVATMSTERETDSVNADGDIFCNVIKNDFDETPLLSAIHNHRGWEIIEALVSGPGGRGASLQQDTDKNNALHLLVGNYADPAAAMSVLKIVPDTASKRNAQGMLPVEVACMQLMPDEVILAIALVDLPFDIEDKEALKINEDLGASWWFLACECDDHHFEIVANVLSICSFQQRRALGFMEGCSSEHKGTVLSRATPKCRQLLSQGLRFVGRFEFVGTAASYSDSNKGLQEFEAIDFGGFSDKATGEEGKKVTLRCYTMKRPFLEETSCLRGIETDSLYIEEVLTFGVNEALQADGTTQQYCISIEKAQLTLDKVVNGMIQKGRYQYDTNLQKKYVAKIAYVLRAIAKALRHLHEVGTVHGNVCLENCGRFEHVWKLRGRLGLQKIGEIFDPSKFHQSFPPDALVPLDNDREICDSDDAAVSFKSDLIASTSIDIWAFGKLAYEAFVGEPLINFDPSMKPREDVVSLLEILEWNEENMRKVFENLLDSGVPESGAEMITSCLFARPEERPRSMLQILDNPFWKDMRRFRDRSKRTRRPEDSTSSVYTETTRSMYTETSEI